jgi:glycosyltransferase involved in cell wall biosynthesis
VVQEASDNPIVRPQVSVCMAAYNGDQYIQEQLQSILGQLSDEDEVIIVDDASTDRTRARIMEDADSRIKLLENGVNIGIRASFERALRNASGKIIFFSDQDDIWEQDKVMQVLQIFRMDPATTLVLTNGIKIEKDGKVTGRRVLKTPVKFGIVNTLAKNPYYGCLMAFRRELLELCLPIPSSNATHDSWIGTVNFFIGKAYYLDKDLVYYRRHGGNATKEVHGPIWKMIVFRFHFIVHLLRRIPRLIRNRPASKS